MRPVVSAVASLVAVTGLVGCSAPAAGPQGAPASPTATAATPTTSSTPTPTPAEGYSNAELGIVFEDDPSGRVGDEADVYQMTALYETEYWRTMTTNTASGVFGTIASPEIEARMQQIAADNTGIQAKIGGVYRVDVQEVVVEGDSARSVVCLDYAEATFTDPTGSWTSEDVGLGGEIREELSWARVADRVWVVLTSTVTETC